MSLGPNRNLIYYYCHIGKCPNSSSDCVTVIYAIQERSTWTRTQGPGTSTSSGRCQDMLSCLRSWVCWTIYVIPDPSRPVCKRQGVQINVQFWPQSGAKRTALTHTLFEGVKDQRKVQMMQITKNCVSKHNKWAILNEVIQEDLRWVVHFQIF